MNNPIVKRIDQLEPGDLVSMAGCITGFNRSTVLYHDRNRHVVKFARPFGTVVLEGTRHAYMLTRAEEYEVPYSPREVAFKLYEVWQR
jgi:hypothetical protein